MFTVILCFSFNHVISSRTLVFSFRHRLINCYNLVTVAKKMIKGTFTIGNLVRVVNGNHLVLWLGHCLRHRGRRSRIKQKQLDCKRHHKLNASQHTKFHTLVLCTEKHHPGHKKRQSLEGTQSHILRTTTNTSNLREQHDQSGLWRVG